MHFERRKGGRHHASTNRNNPHRETARSPAALRVRTFRHVPSPSWRPSSGRPSSAGQNYATGRSSHLRLHSRGRGRDANTSDRAYHRGWLCLYRARSRHGCCRCGPAPLFSAPALLPPAARHAAHTHRRFAPGMPQRTFLTLGKPTQAAIRAGPKCRILTASRSGSTVPLASTLSRYTYIYNTRDIVHILAAP